MESHHVKIDNVLSPDTDFFLYFNYFQFIIYIFIYLCSDLRKSAPNGKKIYVRYWGERGNRGHFQEDFPKKNKQPKRVKIDTGVGVVLGS